MALFRAHSVFYTTLPNLLSHFAETANHCFCLKVILINCSWDACIVKVEQRRTHSSRSLLILVSVIFAIFFHQVRISLFISYIVLFVSFAIGLAFFIKDSRRFNLPLILNGNFLTLLSLFLIFIIAPLVRVKLMTELPAVFALRDWQTSYPKVNILVCAAIFALISGSSITRENASALNLQLEPLHINTRKAIRFSAFLILVLAVYFLNWARSQGSIFEVLFGSRAQRAV